MSVQPNEPLTVEAQVELSRIQAENLLAVRQRQSQTIAIVCVTMILLAVIAGEIVLTLNNKPIPDAFSPLISILAAGLVGVLGYQVGRSQK